MGKREGDGIRKDPRARIGIRDARSATLLYAAMLPTRLLVPTELFNVKKNSSKE